MTHMSLQKRNYKKCGVGEATESPLDFTDIKPVNPKGNES